MIAPFYIKTELPLFVTQTCPNFQYTYIFVMEIFILTNSFVTYGEGISPNVSIECSIYVITWYSAKTCTFFPTHIMATRFSNFCNLGWVDSSHWVILLLYIYHMFTGYSKKTVFLLPQCQCSSNLVKLWVKVKEPHALLHVACGPHDHMIFKKSSISIVARPQNSAGNIKHW